MCILTYVDNQARDELVQARGDGHHDLWSYGDGAPVLVHDDAFHGDGELVQVPCILSRDRLALVCKYQVQLRNK